jgi:hypothetical protein
VNFPFICSNIPAVSTYWVYTSQVDTIFQSSMYSFFMRSPYMTSVSYE